MSQHSNMRPKHQRASHCMRTKRMEGHKSGLKHCTYKHTTKRTDLEGYKTLMFHRENNVSKYEGKELSVNIRSFIWRRNYHTRLKGNPKGVSLLLQLLLLIQNVTANAHYDGSFMALGDADNQKMVYKREGMINFGGVFSIHEYSEDLPCGQALRESGVVQLVEAMIFAIDEINRDPSILDGVKLGFVILDDCRKATTALAQTLHFMPMLRQTAADCGDYCQPHGHSFYEVSGVIGGEGSPSSIMMANLLNIFQIPQISPTATNDMLSDKNKYPNFLRMIPPDQFQVTAILQLLVHFNWTYVSAVYTDGGYGEEAVEMIHKLSSDHGVCMGDTIALPQHRDTTMYDRIVAQLFQTGAIVVVLFLDQEEARGILAATVQAGLTDHFVWLGSDGIGVNLDDFDDYEDTAVGLLTLRAMSKPWPRFQKYFEALTPDTSKNPWFKEMWEDMFGCSWNSTDRTRCSRQDELRNATDYESEVTVSIIIDAVYTLAKGLDNLIKAKCQGLKGDDVVNCIHNTPLLPYLRNLTFIGINGNVTFDKNGDNLGQYELLNFQKSSNPKRYEAVRVGIWDVRNQKLDIDDSLIMWNSKKSLQYGNGIPESHCGKPCLIGEIYVYHKETCCWECRSCNPNEITVNNSSRCIDCPPLKWPDAVKTTCVDIPPDFMHWHQPVVIVLAVLALSGVSMSIIIFIVFIRNHDARIIKATSRELSYIMLAGTTIQYLLILSFVSKPQMFVCLFNYFGFNVSFALVYAPLLTRTNRIFRIFEAGQRTKVLPSFTSSASQVVIVIGLVAAQVVISTIVMVLSPPDVRKRMPVLMEAHVEMECAFPVKGFITSLSYNIFLVALCTVYAFKSRSLPDNFNESRCISLCVYTTVVVWLAFLPTYFTTSRAYFQVILISCDLLFNSTVILLSLYIPRIYALRQERHSEASTNGQVQFKYKSNASPGLVHVRSTTSCLQTEDQGTELSDLGPST